MRYLKYAALLGVLLFAAAGSAHAQVRVGVAIGGPVVVGPAPVCAYGYYGYYPYACAPYGYYGPDYFVNGVFIGAGPWYHGYYGHYWGRPYYGRGFYGRGYYGRGYWHGDRDFHEGFRGGRGDFHDNGWRRGEGSHGHEGGFHGGGGFRGGGRGR